MAALDNIRLVEYLAKLPQGSTITLFKHNDEYIVTKTAAPHVLVTVPCYDYAKLAESMGLSLRTSKRGDKFAAHVFRGDKILSFAVNFKSARGAARAALRQAKVPDEALS